MKKVLIVIAIVIGIFFISLLLVPVLFKDQIKAAVDDALSSSVNADVVWNSDDFSLSLLRHFPNATASLKELGVVNRAPFENEVLFLTDRLEVEIDMFSLLGDKIKVRGITLDRPVINILVNEAGQANYDIAFPDSTTVEPDTTVSSYNVGIDHWQINNGTIRYEDATLPMKLVLKNVNHSGSGNLTQDVFDLDTYSSIDSASLSYDGVEYVSDKKLEADVILTISDDYSTYSFKENYFKINDLNIGMDGTMALPDEGMQFDLTVSAKDNSFKSLLSLVPGMYTEDFSKLESEGKLDFEAKIKGVYDSLHIPAFNLRIGTDNAMFKYPDLPEAVRNIQLDLTASNEDGILENTRIELKKFHMEMGQNPVDMRLVVENLRDYTMDASIKARLNLDELTTFFPIEDMTLRGQGTIDLTAKGRYDSISNVMPQLSANLGLTNGYVKTGELPYALDNLQLEADLANTTGNMKDFIANVHNLSFVLDGSPFKAGGTIRDLSNYSWNINATGKVDLEKMGGIMDLQDMSMKGVLDADIHTKGTMAALEAERYGDLPTSGSMTLQDFVYQSKDLPYDITLSMVTADFDPEKINLREMAGQVGRSDFSANGSITHYIAYAFGENQTVQGELNLSSRHLDLNEFMEGEEDVADNPADTASGIIPVPDNVNMKVNASVNRADIMNMALSDIKGQLVIKNQRVDLSNLIFTLLGGRFGVTGSYATPDNQPPAYNFGLDVQALSISKAFTTFDIVKNYAPIAQNLTGNISSDLNISGLLNADMSPDLGSVDAKGMFRVAQAALKDSPILKGLSSVTGFNNLSNDVTLKDVLMSFKIADGKLMLQPFQVNLGDYQANIEGATTLEGGLAYTVSMNVPAGKAGSQINSFLSQYNVATNEGDEIPISIGIGGTYKDPKAVLLMDEQKELVKEALKEKAREETREGAGKIIENVKDEKTRDMLNDILGTGKKDSTKADSLKAPATGKDSVRDGATKIIKDLFNRKKKDDQ